MLGYPVEDIERTLHTPVTEPGLLEARERLKTGRNEPCLCGSGRKYKKCCLRADEEAVRAAAEQARVDASTREKPTVPRGEVATPVRKPGEVSETDRRLDELWQGLDSLSSPSTTQIDEWLEQLLALPFEATEWNEVLNTCAQKGHSDLPAVFRRIAARVPHTAETSMGFFYWAAAEEFTRHGLEAVLPEVAAGFAQLDEHSYEADALVHLEDFLLAGRLDTEALTLAERFLPVVRGDTGLMPHAAIEQCNLVFELRAGAALRGGPETPRSPQVIAQALQRDLQEDIDDRIVERAAQVTCETADPAWSRASFDLVTGDIRKSKQAWQDCQRLYETLLRVAREAWRIDGVPSGWALVGLSRLLESMYGAQSRDGAQRKESKKRRSESQRGNFLDYLNPSGLEERIARACRGVLGVNVPRAQILVDACTVLLKFARRHELIDNGAAGAVDSELARLRGVLSAR